MSEMITASCEFQGHDLKDLPVLNPGGWWGKCWLIEVGGSYTPLWLVVEADTVSDAIDEVTTAKPSATSFTSPRGTSATIPRTSGITTAREG